MVDFFMSATDARPVGQLKSIAKKLNVDTGTLKNHELMFAGAVMATNVALLMSTLNTLSVEVASGALVLLSTLIAFSFDETPLRMRGGKRKRRCLTGGGNKKTLAAPEASTLATPTSALATVPLASGKIEHDPAILKILQSECKLGFLTRRADTGKLSILFVPIQLPLQHLDKATGGNLKQCIDFLLKNYVCVDDVRAICDSDDVFHTNAFMGDRAGANDTCITGIHAEPETEIPTLRLPCYAHIADTSQGRCYGTISGDISGIIHLSLYMESGGQVSAFRAAIKYTLLDKVHVHDAPPPPSDHPRCVHRDLVFHMLIDQSTKEGRARTHALKQRLQGDIQSDVIDVYVIGGREAFDAEEWADATSYDLFPRQIRPFPRTRWLQTLVPVREWALLGNVHHLLKHAGIHWLGQTGKPSQAASKPKTTWALSPSDDETDPAPQFGAETRDTDGDKLVVPFVYGPDQKQQDPSKVWSEFNQHNKDAGLKMLREREPSDRLFVACNVLPVALDFLTRVEYIGSTKAASIRAENLAKGKPYSCPMLEAYSGKLRRKVEESTNALFQEGPWAALKQAGRTFGLATIAFVMISTVHCALVQMGLEAMGTFPFMIWSLLVDATVENAQAILDTSRCLLDSWTRKFLSHFSTVAKLLSDTCRGVLMMIGWLVKFDICQIECRHSMIRRLARQSDTWLPLFHRVSAGLFLARMRKLSALMSRQKVDGPREVATTHPAAEPVGPELGPPPSPHTLGFF